MADEPLLTAEKVAELPFDERLLIAFSEVGLDESDAQAALDVALPMLATHLRAIAAQVEWTHRSMTFRRDGQSTTRLHRSGQSVRAYADALCPPGGAGRG